VAVAVGNVLMDVAMQHYKIPVTAVPQTNATILKNFG